MTGSLRRFLLLAVIGLTHAGLAANAAPCCPFCTMQGQTLTDEINQASMVLYGTLQKPTLDRNGGQFGEGTTELVIETVVKHHDALNDPKVVQSLNGKKVVVLNRYIPIDRDNKYKFLVFCDIFKNNVDPYRGLQVRADSDVAKYLAGALAIRDKDVPTRLKYFFDYLDNADVEVSNDAYREFANADYKDIRPMAKDLPAEKVAKWLQDPKTPAFRFGLYASMLGHCGKPEQAGVLREMLDNPDKRATSGVDGILAGYTMLKPKEGWEHLRGILSDPSRDFTTRYAALRSVRFLWDNRPDIVTKADLLGGISLLLDHDDIADLAIEDLRKWGQWGVVDRIFALNMRKSHDIPIIRRAILRFALSCPSPQAVAFVKTARQKDPQMVQDAEELLKLEAPPPTPQPAQK